MLNVKSYKSSVMKRLSFFLFVAILSLSSLHLYADNEIEESALQIPLENVEGIRHGRGISNIEAFYWNDQVHISTAGVLGIVYVSLLNLNSGEMVCYYFDTSIKNLASMQSNATHEAHKQILSTKNGKTYIGNFSID